MSFGSFGSFGSLGSSFSSAKRPAKGSALYDLEARSRMAKRKRAAALFEVIHADKRFPNRYGSGSSTGAAIAGWWSRRREAREARVASASDAAPSGPSGSSGPSGPSLLTRLFSHVPEVPRIGLQMDPERQEVRFQ